MSSQRVIFLAAAACMAIASPGIATADTVSVHIDEVSPITVSGPVSQIIVGNPSIADVTLTDRRHLMILGRTYGVTNLVALDGVGRRIFETTVNVGPAAAGRVSLFRGVEVNNYACSDRCERTPMPGESQGVFKSYDSAYTDYISRAKASSGGGGNP